MPLLKKRWRSSPNFDKTSPQPDPTVETVHSTGSLPAKATAAAPQSPPRRFRSSMRVASVSDSLHQKGLHHSTTDDSLTRCVSFGTIQIRDYERVAGDNPSVTLGVPLALGWHYMEYADIPVELYEDSVNRRSKSELIMSAQVRKSLLKKEWNVSQREIASAVRSTVRCRNQRRQTVVNGENLLVLEHVKEGWRSCVRKIARKRKSSKDDLASWSQEDDQVDYMDRVTVSDDSLNKTKHKSAEFKIEIEEEETCATSATGADSYLGSSDHNFPTDEHEEHPEALQF